MNVFQFFTGTIMFAAILAVSKIVVFGFLNPESLFVKILLFAFIVASSISVVRRLGILNYFESIFLSIFWLLLALGVDFLVVTKIIGQDVYKTWTFWLVTLAAVSSVIIFHKKLHVENRKQAK